MPSSNAKPGSGQRLSGAVPKSERQQMALVLQMTDSQSVDSDGARGRGDRNERGETPLHVAAIRGDLEQVKMLLHQGADPNASDFAGWKPLHEACNHGWLEVSRVLLEKGAHVNAKGLADDTPLHDACVNGHIELIKLLVERGADPSQKNRRGKTAHDVATPEARHFLDNPNEASNSSEGDCESQNKAEMRRLPTHGKEKCGSPRVTLRLHHLKEKKEKAKATAVSADHDSYDNSNMDTKPGSDDLVASSKEGGDDTVEGGGGGEGKENIGDSGGNGGEGSKEGGPDSSAPVKRTHSTEEEEDTRKKRRKDDAPSRGKSGSNSGGSPKSAIGGESENEDNKSVESPGPKVPPLKIVIPGASLEEQGNRSGKNGTARHHQALPYVVTTEGGSGSGNGSGNGSGESSSPPPPVPSVTVSAPPTSSSSTPAQPADQEPSTTSATPANTTTASSSVEEQRTHQRVLRSHRSGNSGNSSGASGNPSPVGGAEAVSPRQVSPTPGADAPAELGATTTSVEEKPDEAQQPGNVGSSAVGSEAAPPPNLSPTSSPSVAPTSTPAPTSPSTTAPPAPPPTTVELHPRKRKLKPKEQLPPPEAHPEPPAAQPAEQPVTNCYQLFLNIRKQIDRRRKGLFPVQPKPPQGFKDYLMNRCTYVLAGNSNSRVPPPHASPPASLNPGIRDLFVGQEKERYRLRMQHVIEKEKLVLSVEQEILRVHGRAARALANQALPFSVCTILRDEEVYSPFTPEQEEKDRNARSRYNGRLFLSWLQDVDDKWEKIKEAMLLRHHNEAESLHAVQKMDWEWKMKELGICESKAKPVIEDSHVPMVHVSDDFDLLPA